MAYDKGRGTAILSPSTDITGEVGPMKVMPSGFNRSGNLGFSDACPQPGQTASTPDALFPLILGECGRREA